MELKIFFVFLLGRIMICVKMKTIFCIFLKCMVIQKELNKSVALNNKEKFSLFIILSCYNSITLSNTPVPI